MTLFSHPATPAAARGRGGVPTPVGALRQRRRRRESRSHRTTLYAQVVASNALVVTLLIFLDVVLLRAVDPKPDLSSQLLIVMSAIAVSLTLNVALLSRQFRPLDDLVETMETIDITQPGAKAEVPEHATEDIIELFDSFNHMVARLEHERQRRAAAAVRAQEAERARVARDLHDEANQALTAVLLRLEAASHNATPAVAEEIREAKQLAGQAIEELLEVARRLRPTVLDLGLRNALQALYNRTNASSDLCMTLTVDDAERELSKDVELAVYRIAQEALNNVLQHASASKVDVRFVANHPLVLEVADDGQGFDPDEPTARYGVAGMRERALLAGGTMNIYSEPGKGTTVRLEIP
jgi:two-component system sensor histidine kinase UhpB